MADILCGYTAERDETLIAYVYGEIEPAQRSAFDAHIATCERCRKELADLQSVRVQLQDWTAPEVARSGLRDLADAATSGDRAASMPGASPAGISPAGAIARLRDIPAWAQVAAALLFLGVSAGIANLDVRYDRSGLSVHTGWSRPAAGTESERRAVVTPPAASPASAPTAAAAAPWRADLPAPWRADLTALERQLRTEFRGAAPAGPAASLLARDTASADAQLLRRVRALIEDSERKQENELALRIADVVREFDTKRGTDLVKIDRTLRVIQSNTGLEVQKQQQINNYLYRAASQNVVSTGGQR